MRRAATSLMALVLTTALSLAAHAGVVGAVGEIKTPTISEPVVSFPIVGALGGFVEIRATVKHATTCSLSSDKPIADLPTSVGCFIAEFSMPPDAGKKAVAYRLTISATGSTTVTKEVTITVDPASCSKFVPYADMADCNLSNVQQTYTTLTGSDLSGATLTDANLTADDFAASNLTDAVLLNTELLDDNFTNADLSGATVGGADLSGTDLVGVRSGGITGTPSALATNWTLTAGYLIGPSADLAGADLQGADLAGADLSQDPRGLTTDLGDADLSGADLMHADLTSAFLISADLTDADLTDADLIEANLTDATLTGTEWSNTTCPDGTNSNNDGGSCTNHLSS